MLDLIPHSESEIGEDKFTLAISSDDQSVALLYGKSAHDALMRRFLAHKGLGREHFRNWSFVNGKFFQNGDVTISQAIIKATPEIRTARLNKFRARVADAFRKKHEHDGEIEVKRTLVGTHYENA